MGSFERRASAAIAAAAVAVGALSAQGMVSTARAEAPEPVFRQQAPITIEQGAAFVRLPLPVSAYAASRQGGLADLRIVDARGTRVPFALLGPRAMQAREAESLRPADLYALPALRPGEKELASPIEVQVVGDRITVRRFERRATAGGGVTAGSAPRPSLASPGWLIDLGERPRDEAPPTSLRLAWSGPAEFTAAFDLDVSDDLKHWRRASGGQLLALTSASGNLAQREVRLPTDVATARSGPRFVRLRWADPANAPQLSGVQQVRVSRSSVALDPPTSLSVAPGPEPAGPSAALNAGAGKAAPAEGALHYDLGALLPLVEIDLPLPAGHRVAPVRVQGRSRIEEPWRDLAQTVFYRIERGDTVDRPPPLALSAAVRYVRLVPDARSGALPAATPLTVQAQLLSAVFAPQGQPPFMLLAGSADAPPGALPIATLVPALDGERARFGRANLGAWSENEAAVRDEAWRQRLTTWRPVLLWAVLLLGVGGLGWVVWRLARGAQGTGASPVTPAETPAAAPSPQADAERST
ncbi:MAG: DUF3999 family protein [Rubrivivax sp.]